MAYSRTDKANTLYHEQSDGQIEYTASRAGEKKEHQ